MKNWIKFIFITASGTIGMILLISGLFFFWANFYCPNELYDNFEPCMLPVWLDNLFIFSFYCFPIIAFILVGSRTSPIKHNMVPFVLYLIGFIPLAAFFYFADNGGKVIIFLEEGTFLYPLSVFTLSGIVTAIFCFAIKLRKAKI